MSGRNKINVVATASLQFEHYLSQTFVGDFVPGLLLMRLRNLIVLAIDTPQIAIAEKDVSRPPGARERRLFAKVWRV